MAYFLSAMVQRLETLPAGGADVVIDGEESSVAIWTANHGYSGVYTAHRHPTKVWLSFVKRVEQSPQRFMLANRSRCRPLFARLLERRHHRLRFFVDRPPHDFLCAVEVEDWCR